MKILVSIFLLSFCTTVLSQSSGDNGTTPEQNVTSSTSFETTTLISSTMISSTTEVPTTLSTDSSNTTISPSPSTSPSPSPITSTAAPEPAKCTWNITEKGETCILAELQAKFIIPFEDKNLQLLLGCNATAENSDCSSNETQVLVLSEDDYVFTLIFEKKEAKVHVRNVSLTYSLPEAKGDVGNNSDNIFSVDAGNSYLCKSKSEVHLENVTMEIGEIHIQAFADGSKDFGKVEECAADDKVDDIVPIAVGVALGALIIIVLIAYLVGRRRSRQKGYQSV